MNRKKLVLTTAALLSIIFVASAFLPALAQAESGRFYIVLENRTGEPVNFKAAWSNRIGSYQTEYKQYRIPPGHAQLYWARDPGLSLFLITMSNGGSYKCMGDHNASGQGVRYGFKYDQDNVVMVRLR